MESDELTQEAVTSGRTISYWIDSVKPIQYSPLAENLKTDVVIVGGGIAGISIAYSLAMKGKKVVLVEDGFIGSGETGRTTAHLTAALDDRYFKIERLYGSKGAKLAAESHTKAIDFIEDTIKRENIDCDFKRVNGYLFLHPSDKLSNLKKEFKAAQKAGLPVEWLENVPGITGIKSKCIQFNNQAQFHAMKYVAGLCKALDKMNVRIFTETHAKKIDHEGIETNDGFTVKAKHIVVATNSPVNDLFAMHTKQTANRTYAMAARIQKNSMMNALWWDTGDMDRPEVPYHYARIQPFDETHDLLIIGGEDHTVGNTNDTHLPEEKRFEVLEKWMRKYFTFEDIVYRWSGEVLEPIDGLAFTGRNPMDKPNVYIHTGDSGNGLTHGTIAGMLIPDLILKKKNPWKKLYNPSRFKILHPAAAKEFIRNNFLVMLEYLKDFPGTGEISKLDKLQNGHADVVQVDGEKLAVYKDEHGGMHIVSAVCTHLQCVVHWNNEEKSWDCPCHGSRFTYEGKVMNGPANSDLPYRKVAGKKSVNTVNSAS